MYSFQTSNFNYFNTFLVNYFNLNVSNEIISFFSFFYLNAIPPATGKIDLTIEPKVPGKVTKFIFYLH